MLQRGGKTAFPRLYKRVRPSGNMARAAKIIVDPKTPVINCNVVDYSAGGACLQLEKFVKLPGKPPAPAMGMNGAWKLSWSTAPMSSRT